MNFDGMDTTPLGIEELKDAAALLGIELAAIQAVAEVEAPMGGFLPSKRPVILFESRVFHERTGGIYDLSHPQISTPKWVRNYLGGEREYERLEEAMQLDRLAALASCSWGKFQIMGFNYRSAGYGGIEAFVVGMKVSERAQLIAFANVLRAWNLVDHLKHHRWAQFAERYNGVGYRQNRYDEKLMAAYEKYARLAKASVAT